MPRRHDVHQEAGAGHSLGSRRCPDGLGTSAAPLSRATLDFAAIRDDNGIGIAVDGSYVYPTAEHGSIGTEDGVTGDTRLYIGQYLALEDVGDIAPAVIITSPTGGATVVEGEEPLGRGRG